MPGMFTDIWELIDRGGYVMWPLLAMLVVGLTLCFERLWFWSWTNRPGRLQRVLGYSKLLRRGEHAQVRRQAVADYSVYGRVAATVSEQGEQNAKQAVQGRAATPAVSAAAVTEAVEAQRGRLERFMPTLSTIITAAPMLGILGTVLGIIRSFRLLSDEAGNDPRLVGMGIAEALLTTAAGLVIALVILFPYNAFRAQMDRTLGRLEMLAESGETPAAGEAEPATDADAMSE